MTVRPPEPLTTPPRCERWIGWHQLGTGDFVGVYTGAEAATQDVKQGKPIAVKGEQTVQASFALGKSP